MGVIGAVLRRLPGAPVDKDQIPHDKDGLLACAAVHVLQLLVEHSGLFLILSRIPHRLEDLTGPIGEGNRPVALLCLRRPCPPDLLFVTELQGLVDRERPPLPVDGVPGQPNQLSSPQAGFQDQGILRVIVGTPGRFQEFFLFLHGQKFDVVHRPNRLCVSHAIHGVFCDQIIHHSGTEQSPHRDVCLSDGGAGIICLHGV